MSFIDHRRLQHISEGVDHKLFTLSHKSNLSTIKHDNKRNTKSKHQALCQTYIKLQNKNDKQNQFYFEDEVRKRTNSTLQAQEQPVKELSSQNGVKIVIDEIDHLGLQSKMKTKFHKHELAHQKNTTIGQTAYVPYDLQTLKNKIKSIYTIFV